MPSLSARVDRFTDSVIRRMTRICNQYGAINLSQGFPDFDPPKPLLDKLAQVAYEGPHQYPTSFGAQNLREALARKQSRDTGLSIDPDTQVLITCGGTEAMLSAIMTVCDPGDKVVVFSPFYENYRADTILAGAEAIFVPLIPPTFHFDKEVLEDAFRQGPKAIIVCNPSNPCGKVFTREELEYIGSLAVKYDAFVITDEVYEHIVFAPSVHVHMAALPGMFDRTITCNSMSKTYSITGWRLGYIIGPEAILTAAKKVHDFLTIVAPGPLQEAACVGVDFPPSYYDELQALYTRKRDFFCNGLDELGLRHTLPQGSYFLLLDISDFLALPAFAGWTDYRFAEWMIQEIGVATVPGSSFFREEENRYLRLHFARSEETLAEALRRMKKMTALLK